MSDSHSIQNSSATDTKSSWIATYGSPELQSIYHAGYSCDTAYAIERIKLDYPGFEIAPSFRYDRADSPHAYVFAASLEYSESYCYTWANTTGIAIDNYLGKHQIFKKIEVPAPAKEASESEDFDDSEYNVSALVKTHANDKKEWILTCGSDELRQAYLNGYECEIGYAKDRLSHDYPGFEISPYQHDRTDTPSKEGLYVCLQYQEENAYICKWGRDEYIFITNYLRSHPIWRKVEDEIESEMERKAAVNEVTNSHQNLAASLCTVIAIGSTVIPAFFWIAGSNLFYPVNNVGNTPTTIPVISPESINYSDFLIK